VQNLKLTIEYDGTAYHGWQAQPGLPTIQATLEETVKRIAGEEVRVIGAGRTDAGVHALGQVANFRTSKGLALDTWRRALNGLLPSDIVVRRVESAPDEFDARRSAMHKSYRYTIWNAPFPSALERHCVLHIPDPLDVASMAKGAAFLIGEHDFSAFRAADDSPPRPVRRVVEARVAEDADRLHFVITGNGFLKHMIRIIVGTLLDVGRGKLSPEDLERILHSKDRQKAGRTAPALGLCLMEVMY
jgi:tRNA pseudouridine38-40 synthase